MYDVILMITNPVILMTSVIVVIKPGYFDDIIFKCTPKPGYFHDQTKISYLMIIYC